MKYEGKVYCLFCATEMVRGKIKDEWEDKQFGVFCLKCNSGIITSDCDGSYLITHIYHDMKSKDYDGYHITKFMEWQEVEDDDYLFFLKSKCRDD